MFRPHNSTAALKGLSPLWGGKIQIYITPSGTRGEKKNTRAVLGIYHVGTRDPAKKKEKNDTPALSRPNRFPCRLKNILKIRPQTRPIPTPKNSTVTCPGMSGAAVSNRFTTLTRLSFDKIICSSTLLILPQLLFYIFIPIIFPDAWG